MRVFLDNRETRCGRIIYKLVDVSFRCREKYCFVSFGNEEVAISVPKDDLQPLHHNAAIMSRCLQVLTSSKYYSIVPQSQTISVLSLCLLLRRSGTRKDG